MEAAPTRQTDEEFFSDWRARELSRVDRAGLSYLDYTGSALYPESLVRADARRLEGALLGNPHSESGPSRAATGDMEAARAAILRYLHADAGGVRRGVHRERHRRLPARGGELPILGRGIARAHRGQSQFGERHPGVRARAGRGR